MHASDMYEENRLCIFSRNSKYIFMTTYNCYPLVLSLLPDALEDESDLLHDQLKQIEEILATKIC